MSHTILLLFFTLFISPSLQWSVLSAGDLDETCWNTTDPTTAFNTTYIACKDTSYYGVFCGCVSGVELDQSEFCTENSGVESVTSYACPTAPTNCKYGSYLATPADPTNGKCCPYYLCKPAPQDVCYNQNDLLAEFGEETVTCEDGKSYTACSCNIAGDVPPSLCIGSKIARSNHTACPPRPTCPSGYHVKVKAYPLEDECCPQWECILEPQQCWVSSDVWATFTKAKTTCMDTTVSSYCKCNVDPTPQGIAPGVCPNSPFFEWDTTFTDSCTSSWTTCPYGGRVKSAADPAAGKCCPDVECKPAPPANPAAEAKCWNNSLATTFTYGSVQCEDSSIHRYCPCNAQGTPYSDVPYLCGNSSISVISDPTPCPAPQCDYGARAVAPPEPSEARCCPVMECKAWARGWPAAPSVAEEVCWNQTLLSTGFGTGQVTCKDGRVSSFCPCTYFNATNPLGICIGSEPIPSTLVVTPCPVPTCANGHYTNWRALPSPSWGASKCCPEYKCNPLPTPTQTAPQQCWNVTDPTTIFDIGTATCSDGTQVNYCGCNVAGIPDGLCKSGTLSSASLSSMCATIGCMHGHYAVTPADPSKGKCCPELACKPVPPPPRPHVIFVRHELTPGVFSLLPHLEAMSKSESFITPFWRPNWVDGAYNTVLEDATPGSILGQAEKAFYVQTYDRATYNFVVRYYTKPYITASTATRNSNYYLIDYSHPIAYPETKYVYEKAWELSVVPLCNFDEALARSQITEGYTETQLDSIRTLVPIFRLCYDHVVVQLLDAIVTETTVVDVLSRAATVPVFAAATTPFNGRKWTVILTFEDYSYFRPAISPAAQDLFQFRHFSTTAGWLNSADLPFLSSTGFFVPEALAVHYASYVVVPAKNIHSLLRTDSSTHVPFPFYSRLRSELLLASDQGRMRVVFPSVEPHPNSLPARLYGDSPLGPAIANWKSAARLSLRERYPTHFCSNKPAYRVAWVTDGMDVLDGTEFLEDYAMLFADNNVCLMVVSGVPCAGPLKEMLQALDESHDIMWLQEAEEGDTARLVMLAADFGFMPNVEAGWGLTAVEHLMHGNRLITTSRGGIADVAIPRTPSSPTLTTFQTALGQYNSTATLEEWTDTPDLCSSLWASFLPNSYTFTLTRSRQYYSIPDLDSLQTALGQAINDKSNSRDIEGTHLHSLLLQGHCYSWMSSRTESVSTYLSMLSSFVGVYQFGPMPSPFALTAPQRAMLVASSEHTIANPATSLSPLAIQNGLEFKTLHLSLSPSDDLVVLALPPVSPSLLARYTVANIIDRKHFPDVQCLVDPSDTPLSPSDNLPLLLSVELSFSPLSSLTSDQYNSWTVKDEVTQALNALHASNFCHGNLSAENILIQREWPNKVYLVGLIVPAVGDQTESTCISGDLTSFLAISQQYSL